MQAKPWYQSKTIWFNVLTGVLMFLALPEFVSMIPATALPTIALLNASGNLVLRLFFTSGPVTGTETKAAIINANPTKQ